MISRNSTELAEAVPIAVVRLHQDQWQFSCQYDFVSSYTIFTVYNMHKLHVVLFTYRKKYS